LPVAVRKRNQLRLLLPLHRQRQRLPAGHLVSLVPWLLVLVRRHRQLRALLGPSQWRKKRREQRPSKVRLPYSGFSYPKKGKGFDPSLFFAIFSLTAKTGQAIVGVFPQPVVSQECRG